MPGFGKDAPGWKALPRVLGEAQPWTSLAIVWSGVGLENAVVSGSDGSRGWGKPWSCHHPIMVLSHLEGDGGFTRDGHHGAGQGDAAARC